MQGKYSFIKLEKVTLRNFSLYSKQGNLIPIEEEINEGVYCLAGANGLGKSTFLNTINYGLTGIVLDPDKKEAYIPEEIVKFNKNYTERYFEGRIKAKDKDKSEIELLLRINGKYIRLIRSFVDREGLMLLEFYENSAQKKYSVFKTDNLSPKELQQQFENIIESETGIGRFSYFIFFQLYVMSFDETRRMLFWDENASTSALNIAFNDDIRDTERMLELKKTMEEFESYGRNSRWQATQLKNEIDKLINTSTQNEDSSFKMLESEFFELLKDIEDSEKLYNEINIEYDTLLKRQNLINSEILQLKINYRKLFSQYSEPRSNLINNPLIQIAKRDNKCFLCNAEGHNIIESIERKLFSQPSCPACDTPINNGDEKVQFQLMSQIKKIDKDLEERNKDLEDLMLETETKKIELDKKYVELNRLNVKLNKFEKENKGLTFGKTGEAPIDTLIEEYQRQYNKLDKNSIDYYSKRDHLLPEYRNLQRKVEKGFKETQDVFVPLFKELAYSFIGLDLNLYAKPKGKSMVFNFIMKDTARTASHQLSESQRFFLDIALRMALSVYLFKKGNEGTLLIDTPEGSLDIAYENRVGKMFAQFVTKHNQHILMTANINASQLLLSLAEQCTNEKMIFRRMLEWTDLSEIQNEGEYLFDKVYNNIENKLKGIY